MIRREKARIVAQRVAARIREVVPVGLGHWGPVWDLVAMPSDVFMDALAEWQTEDSSSSRRKLQAASTDLISAWAEAALCWEEEGRPTLVAEREEVNVPVTYDDLLDATGSLPGGKPVPGAKGATLDGLY